MNETLAIVCGHIFRNERRVRAVIRHAGGVWQLVCGETDHPVDCSDFEPVGLEHLLERQANLVEIVHLGEGNMAAETSSGWIVEPYEEGE
jgi:hypothetical protein